MYGSEQECLVKVRLATRPAQFDKHYSSWLAAQNYLTATGAQLEWELCQTVHVAQGRRQRTCDQGEFAENTVGNILDVLDERRLLEILYDKSNQIELNQHSTKF